MAASDAIPVPRKNTAWRMYFAIRKNDGTLITSWAGADTEISKDGAAFADCTNEATEIGTSGCGYIDLTSTEMNADNVIIKTTVTNTDALPLVTVVWPEEAGDYRLAATPPTAGEVADAVWDEATSGHTTSGTFGEQLKTDVDAILADTNELQTNQGNWLTATGFSTHSAADAADAVWEELIADHSGTSGSTAEALAAAGSAGDPWSTALPGAYSSGTAGYILGTNLDAAISSRMATYTQPTGFLAATFPGTVASTTNITAGTITTTTNLTNLPTMPTDWITSAGLSAGAVTEIQSGLATAANLATVAGYLDTEIAAILADTNELQTNQGNWLTATGFSTHSAADAADAVWEELIADHSGTAGSTAEALAAAGSAGDPWSTALPGAYSAGTAGYIIGTNLNATVSSRMATYTQPTGFLAATFPSTVASTTNITGGTITTVTNLTNLPTMPTDWITAAGLSAGAVSEIQSGLSTLDAAGVRTAVGLASANLDTQLGDIPTNSELASAFTEIKGATWSSGTDTLEHIRNAITVVGSDVITNGTVLSLMAGAGFDTATDSLEALRNRGDAAWTTATGFSTHSAADVWAVATRVLTAGTNIVLAKGTGVTGFNDLSAAQVNAEADTALADYDGPTNAEMVSAFTEIKGVTWATTDTLEAIRDRGDAAWITATGFSTHSAADVWAVGSRTITGGTITTYTGNTPQTGDAYAIVNSGTHGNAALKTLIETVDTVVDSILADTGTDGVVLSSATQQSIATALLDLSNGVEMSYTLRQALRLILSSAAAKLSGAGTNTVVFRDIGDTKDRITAGVDGDGNRLSVSVDAT